MVDMHTHILPGIDDGAKDVQNSLCMLNEAKKQGGFYFLRYASLQRIYLVISFLHKA